MLFLFMIFLKGCCFGKHLSINFKNFAPLFFRVETAFQISAFYIMSKLYIHGGRKEKKERNNQF